MWSNGGMTTDRATSKGSEDNLPQIVYHKSNRIYILKLSQQLNSIQSSAAGSCVVLCIILLFYVLYCVVLCINCVVLCIVCVDCVVLCIVYV